MLLAFALAASAKAGLAPEEAIHDAFLLRFRPNLMTCAACSAAAR
jgi:multidrug efflux pump subunit AcrB